MPCLVTPFRSRRSLPVLVLCLLTTVSTGLGSCAQRSDRPHDVVGIPGGSDAGTESVPGPADPIARDAPGLHNLVAFHDGVISGSVPEGPDGFDSLQGLGVRTIVSVDGAVPDVAAARLRGMRYIHLPIGYDGFDETRRAELTRAVLDGLSNGAVYIHCHHGQHRGPAAALTALLNLGTIDQVEASAWLDRCGVAYRGLRNAVQNAEPAHPEDIQSAPPLQEVAETKSLSRLMAEVDG